MVTNGFLCTEPLAELLPWIDAANIDLKSMDDRFYRKVCKAQLAPVLAAIRQTHAAGVHLELTNLVIPGHNDEPGQIDGWWTSWRTWIRTSRCTSRPTIRPGSWRRRPRRGPPWSGRFAQAKRRLRHVYLGNTAGAPGRDTLCPRCGAVAIERRGFAARVLLSGGACGGCGGRLPLVGV